jgi:hypothetical protein
VADPASFPASSSAGSNAHARQKKNVCPKVLVPLLSSSSAASQKIAKPQN